MSAFGRTYLWLLPLLALAAPATAQGQVNWTVEGMAGVYSPSADLVSAQNVQQPQTGQSATVTLEQKSGVAFGLRVGRVLTPKLSLEGELLYASSEIELSGVRPGIGPLTGRADATVLALDVNALYEVFRPPFTPFAVHVMGGLGLVNRSGDFFDESLGFLGELDGGTDIALIVGGGVRYGFTPGLGLRLDVRDYISSYTQELFGADLDAEIQNDFWITGGLELSL